MVSNRSPRWNLISRQPLSGKGSCRTGFTLFELVITSLLLSALIVSAIPALSWAAKQRREVERRQAGLEFLENQLERLTALSFDELTPERAGAVKIPEAFRDRWPEATLSARVIDEPEERAKRINLELRWQEQRGGPTVPIRLTAWIYPHTEQTP